jgi:hypothetical protein
MPPGLFLVHRIPPPPEPLLADTQWFQFAYNQRRSQVEQVFLRDPSILQCTLNLTQDSPTMTTLYALFGKGLPPGPVVGPRATTRGVGEGQPFGDWLDGRTEGECELYREVVGRYIQVREEVIREYRGRMGQRPPTPVSTWEGYLSRMPQPHIVTIGL